MFDLEGGLWLALSRAAWDAALLSSFGALVFWVGVLPRALARAPDAVAAPVHRMVRTLVWASLATAAAALALWLVLQSAAMAGVAGWSAVRDVAGDTEFGQLAVLQLAMLVATALALGRGLATARRWAATGLAAVTTALQAGHGHALAMADGPSLLLGASILHLLAAGAWLGGLLPLLLVVRAAPARTGAAAARWFSPIGKWCVGAMAGTAIVQFWQLIGGLPGLVGTAYGWMATLKLLLFVVLLGFAWVNRYRFAPRLLGGAPDRARSVLLGSIAVQTGFGLLVVLAAALLGSLSPSLHEQPLWPFARHPSLVALSDPDLRAEVLYGGGELLAGLVLVLAGAALWRRRWLAAAGIVAGLAAGSASASHLDLLFVEAYPTSYYNSPTGFAATAISRGAALFPQHCAACHGADGKGDGPAASGLPVPPADLTAEHLWAHSDGELFWWLTHGIEAPEGGLAMPGFSGQLSEDERWAVIDFIRAHNAGASLRDTGGWAVPIQAPAFSMACPGGRNVTMEDLRGSVRYLVALSPGAKPPPPVPQDSPVPVVTVLLTRAPLPPDATACATADPAVWNAYAAVAGTNASSLAGMQFLVDGNGWMRAAQAAGGVRWATPAGLLADVRAICDHPLAAPTGGHVHH